MVDLSKTILAKSDQLNADDLMSGPITITITNVTQGSGEDQPICIRYEGDNGKPWKPCKSMRRVLCALWGSDGSNYIGRRMTIFRDPSVKWAGMEVGGIRISHMSHIDKEERMALTASKGSKKGYIIKPLQNSPQGRAQSVSNAPASQSPPAQTDTPPASSTGQFGNGIPDVVMQAIREELDAATTKEEVDEIKYKASASKPQMTEAQYKEIARGLADASKRVEGGF